MPTLENIPKAIENVRRRIENATKKASRELSSIRFIGVSKGQNEKAIEVAYQNGITAFGENYCQEALRKIKALSSLPIEWHFIGPIQSNKTREIAHHFTWVHSLSRKSVASLLSKHRPPELPPLNTLIQINIDREPQKSGILEEEIESFLAVTKTLPGLCIRGFMAIPSASNTLSERQESFERVKKQMDFFKKNYPELDTLSLGMSEDMEAAICAGSNLLRIGQAIFGERTGEHIK